MVRAGNPLVKVDRQAVIGALRATGSRDPDVLHAQKALLLETAGGPLFLGTILMWSGGIATITVILAPLGVPVLLLGWWLRQRGAANVANVEAGFAEFVGHPGWRERPS